MMVAWDASVRDDTGKLKNMVLYESSEASMREVVSLLADRYGEKQIQSLSKRLPGFPKSGANRKK